MGFQEGIFLERFAMAPSKFTFIMEKDLFGCFGCINVGILLKSYLLKRTL